MIALTDNKKTAQTIAQTLEEKWSCCYMDSIIRGEKVMLSGKARAHTNIALIKYWGKSQ